MKKRSMLAIASLATGFVVAAVTPSHSVENSGTSGTGSPSAGLPGTTGGQVKAAGLDMTGKKLGGLGTTGTTKLAGVNVDQALDTFGKAINRETDRAVNNAPHGKPGKKG
ncbi:hypothetical protein ACWHLZ_33240 [Streptomyces chartreusis]|jgi:hypothetical protein|uniref:ATP-binding protein n=1 Tax=Streptomyces chartreusis TaxID=1969 RepID=A0A7H8TLU9_STRCX|nr:MULTISPECIES: hypothetical protein [Streptomyces]MCZ4605273.1 hypothetical protein [Streptomyces sp. Lzd4kr]MBT1093950.1 hypothetical protein [Streptomyces sp. Tu102]QEV71956.1 hypothetical protein CP983_38460 [Streptomyces chartreusis]QKZ24481.1 hypothetical protein HUT05_48375 [Streptomyces chartreusis]WSZ72880.1 hypothetical protein OG938_38940 [Streptomyces chartreusis]